MLNSTLSPSLWFLDAGKPEVMGKKAENAYVLSRWHFWITKVRKQKKLMETINVELWQEVGLGDAMRGCLLFFRWRNSVEEFFFFKVVPGQSWYLLWKTHLETVCLFQGWGVQEEVPYLFWLRSVDILACCRDMHTCNWVGSNRRSAGNSTKKQAGFHHKYFTFLQIFLQKTLIHY